MSNIHEDEIKKATELHADDIGGETSTDVALPFDPAEFDRSVDLDRGIFKLVMGTDETWSATLDGEPLDEVPDKFALGVVVSLVPVRVKYAGEYIPGNEPVRECASVDGKSGTPVEDDDGGTPQHVGGECARCAWNRFGSAGGGRRGKACKEYRVAVVRFEERGSFGLVQFPPSKLRAFKAFRRECGELGPVGCSVNMSAKDGMQVVTGGRQFSILQPPTAGSETWDLMMEIMEDCISWQGSVGGMLMVPGEPGDATDADIPF